MGAMPKAHVEDAIAMIANENEVRMIDKTPREGAGGAKIAFLHPKSSGRVLTEISDGAHSH